jgi:hypothetical protein
MEARNMPLDLLAAKLRAFMVGRGFPRGVVAATNFAASSPLVLRKITRWIDDDGWVDWSAVAQYVDVSPWSSGEQAAIRFCCSLAGEGPAEAWSLAEMLPTDPDLGPLAVEAVKYAVAS